MKELNLNLIRTHKNMIGKAIVDCYPVNPEETVAMILDQWKDCPLGIIQTIGIRNIFALNLKIYLHENKTAD